LDSSVRSIDLLGVFDTLRLAVVADYNLVDYNPSFFHLQPKMNG